MSRLFFRTPPEVDWKASAIRMLEKVQKDNNKFKHRWRPENEVLYGEDATVEPDNKGVGRDGKRRLILHKDKGGSVEPDSKERLILHKDKGRTGGRANLIQGCLNEVSQNEDKARCFLLLRKLRLDNQDHTDRVNQTKWTHQHSYGEIDKQVTKYLMQFEHPARIFKLF